MLFTKHCIGIKQVKITKCLCYEFMPIAEYRQNFCICCRDVEKISFKKKILEIEKLKYQSTVCTVYETMLIESADKKQKVQS